MSYDNDIFLSIKEVCEFLGISHMTLYRYLKSDPSFPARRVGKRWKFLKSELLAWTEKRPETQKEKQS